MNSASRLIKQAFVLAGGKGERLRPLTNDIPKPLVKVAGKPILEYSVELLARHGVSEIILATGYMHEKIEAHFGSGEKFGVSIVYSVETEPLGTGGALKQAEKMLDGSFFMLNGDNIADFNLAQMASEHFKQKALGTIAVTYIDDVSGYGVAKIENGNICEFIEKPQKGTEQSHYVNSGAYVLEKKALEELPEGFNLIEKTLFPKLAQMGKLRSYTHTGLWQTTDTFERLKNAENAVLARGNNRFTKQ